MPLLSRVHSCTLPMGDSVEVSGNFCVKMVKTRLMILMLCVVIEHFFPIEPTEQPFS